jgi:Na+-transporting methylmalonyl-CoA/oxaloacetate decarboxylase gamma subunit
MSQMLQSLFITAIGMGLVFILIILLWGFMASLVSITNRWDFMTLVKEGTATSEETQMENINKTEVDKPSLVAIAVAAALAASQKTFHLAPIQHNTTSSWLAVTRANTLSQISAISNRKPRG